MFAGPHEPVLSSAYRVGVRDCSALPFRGQTEGTRPCGALHTHSSWARPSEKESRDFSSCFWVIIKHYAKYWESRDMHILTFLVPFLNFTSVDCTTESKCHFPELYFWESFSKSRRATIVRIRGPGVLKLKCVAGSLTWRAP